MVSRALLAPLLAFHFGWLVHDFAPAAAGPDASGYLLQARLLASEGRTFYRPESPVQRAGLHWLRSADGRFFSRYPPGLSVLMVPAYLALGPAGPLLLNPLFATLALLFLYLILEPRTGGALALLAAAAQAVNPAANAVALHGDAQASATAFLLAGIFLLERWARSPSLARAFGAGLTLGVLPTLHYPEAAAAFGVGLFFLLHSRRAPRWLSSVAAASAGAALPIAALLARNRLAFGSFFRTGYDLLGEQATFTLANLVLHGPSSLEEIAGRGLGPLFGLGLAGMAWMLSSRDCRPAAALLAGIALPLTLVYMSFYFGSGVRNLRYYAVTFPLYAVAAFCLFAELRRLAPPRARAALGASLLVLCAWGVPESRERRGMEARRNAAVAEGAAWARSSFPEGSVLVVEEWRLNDALEYAARFKLVDARLMLGPGRTRALRPQGPTNEQLGKRDEEWKRYEGLPPGERAARIKADVFDWAGPAGAVYWIAPVHDPALLAQARGLTGRLVPSGQTTFTVVPSEDELRRLSPLGPVAGATRITDEQLHAYRWLP